MIRRYLLLLACVACDRAGIQHRPGEPDVVAVQADDPDMRDAIAAARQHLTAFVDRLRHPTATQSYTAVKVRLVEGNAVEHVWLSNPADQGSTFRGVLGNAPVDLHGLHVGDTLTVARDSITDWMLIDRDTVYGAFTVHAVRNQMNTAERAHFDAQQGGHFGAVPVLPKAVGRHP